MSITIRGYHEGPWRQPKNDAHENAVVDIENWPHDFDEHHNRFGRGSDGEVYERSDYAGCRICGGSEFSLIHLGGRR